MFGSRFWGVVAAAILGAFLVLGTGCDEEAKEVCCWCECLLQTGGAPEVDIKYTQGTNLNCGTSCRDACLEESRWERGNYSEWDCDDMP